MLFEALLFSIFTWIMFGTQLHAIITDETGIEQLKRELPSWQRRSKWKSLQVRVYLFLQLIANDFDLQIVMGGRFGVDWFNPFVTPFIGKPALAYSV